MSGGWKQGVTPVCSEPKVFIGQIPFEATTEDVQALFSRYGQLRSCQVVTGPDGRSRGCAMVKYLSWTEAEIAVDSENGTTNLGGGRPIAVRFADPPKKGDGTVMAITPKKLFIGQIPNAMPEDTLRGMFAPYGNIVELHMLKKNPAAGCAFIVYDRWSSCEAAIIGLNGKTQLEGVKMPLVVKFADAKTDGGGGGGVKRGFNAMDPGCFLGGEAPMKKALQPGFLGQPGMGLPLAQAPGYGMAAQQAPMMPMLGASGMNPFGVPGMNMGMNMMNYMSPDMIAQAQVAKMGLQGPPPRQQTMGPGVTNEAAKQWKLFVGGIPFEASEYELWEVFKGVGAILELVLLRNPQGKSRGCAFVIYESRELAEAAIKEFDGKVLPFDAKQRVIQVKYAGR